MANLAWIHIHTYTTCSCHQTETDEQGIGGLLLYVVVQVDFENRSAKPHILYTGRATGQTQSTDES